MQNRLSEFFKSHAKKGSEGGASNIFKSLLGSQMSQKADENGEDEQKSKEEETRIVGSPDSLDQPYKAGNGENNSVESQGPRLQLQIPKDQPTTHES